LTIVVRISAMILIS